MKRSCFRTIVWTVLILIVLVTLMHLLLRNYTGPEGSPTQLPADFSTPTPSSVLETTEGITLSGKARLGQLDVEYPILMSPGSSDTIIASIYIPPFLASLAPVSIERVVVPSDVPQIMGGLTSHQTTILVVETMRVELSSLSFVAKNERPLVQEVNINEINQPTYWAWAIQAPDRPGIHTFTISVFMGDGSQPSWTGAFRIEVAEPTSTPVPTSTSTPTPTSTPSPTPTPTVTPTPTPLPVIERVADQLINNSSSICTALIALVGVLAGVLVSIKTVRNKKKSRTRK